ncbi:DUF547 domain-containing protein [Patiriisocius marinistellae]|uniref:DUF547 domain-containing protein n=1 Tax=Patiriisocius marinistellae TaxID=2494560 RepID=A0A5J4G003_9FLAO|nr:DUF547 domain-containing protein [Patiriisocius marinistellae]GEQ85331.1 DUF547 domain-containing protein [Patiriisocius marinistellae]
MKSIKYVLLLSIAALTLQSCNLLSAAGVGSQAQPVKEVTQPLTSTTANSAVNVNHEQWTGLLKTFVNDKGLVDYKGFKKNEQELDEYLDMLASKDPNNDWSPQELLAYYINLYNAQTVKLIVDNYPTKSIKDISGAWTKGRARVDGRELSLGGIENGILRKMNEPRIHFAINCASISCPKLLNEAYTAAKINEQLDQVTKEFINSKKNEISAKNPKISSIFSFYPKDFKVDGEQDIAGYINKYSTTKIDAGAPLTYKEYDWNLNEQ